MASPKSAVFLDRDGVLNVEGGAYIRRPEDLHMLPGAADAVAQMTQCGWTVFVYTNQSGVGRGYMTLDDLGRIHGRLQEEIERAGGRITQIYACPHAPDFGCECRKPKPGLLNQAAQDHDIDLSSAYAVGDSPRDIGAAHAAGCRTVLVLSGHTESFIPAKFPDPAPDHVFADISAFANWLCAQS